MLLCPWYPPGKIPGMDCHAFLQANFSTQGSNPGLPHCSQILYCLSHQKLMWNNRWGEKRFTSSIQFSHSVVSNSLGPHGLQHTRPTCPSPNPRAYSNSCPLSRWCHPTISSPVTPYSSHLQSSPASGSFQMSQFFASGGQSIGVSASASVVPMNIQD